MNQILQTKDNFYFYENILFEKKKIKKKYLFIFFLSIMICIIIAFYLLYSYFSKLNQNKKANILKDKYNVTTLYSNNDSNYSTIRLSNDISIIGLIEIPSINISYPILSNSNEDLLKISVCRFFGPLPNRNGNLCIAGHNYKNSMMFSKLYKLNINDSIFITDLNNVRLEYTIYEKSKIKENNLDCTKDTLDTQITLITCNDTNNKERIVVKAKVKA